MSRPPSQDPIVLGPCASRFRSAAELVERLTPARQVRYRLAPLAQAVLLRIGALEYASWEIAWKADLDDTAGEARDALLADLVLLGLVEDFGDKVHLSDAGCRVWAELDAARSAPPEVVLMLDTLEDALLRRLEAASAAWPEREILAEHGQRAAHALRRLAALGLIERDAQGGVRAAPQRR